MMKPSDMTSTTIAPSDANVHLMLKKADQEDAEFGCPLSFTGAAAPVAVFTPHKSSPLEEGNHETYGDDELKMETSVISSHTAQDALLAFVNTNSPMPAKTNAFTPTHTNHHTTNNNNNNNHCNIKSIPKNIVMSMEEDSVPNPDVRMMMNDMEMIQKGESDEERGSVALFSENGESPSASRPRSCTNPANNNNGGGGVHHTLHMDHLLQRLIATSEQQFTAATEAGAMRLQQQQHPQQPPLQQMGGISPSQSREEDAAPLGASWVHVSGGSNAFTPSNATVVSRGGWSMSRPSEDRPGGRELSLERSPSPAAPTAATAAFTPRTAPVSHDAAAISSHPQQHPSAATSVLPCFSTAPVRLFDPVVTTASPGAVAATSASAAAEFLSDVSSPTTTHFSTSSRQPTPAAGQQLPPQPQQESSPSSVMSGKNARGDQEDEDEDEDENNMWEQHAACMRSDDDDDMDRDTHERRALPHQSLQDGANEIPHMTTVSASLNGSSNNSDHELLFLLRAMEAQENERGGPASHSLPMAATQQTSSQQRGGAFMPPPPLSAANMYNSSSSSQAVPAATTSEWCIHEGDHHLASQPQHPSGALAYPVSTGTISPPPPQFNPFILDPESSDALSGITREELERRQLDAFQRLQLVNTGLLSPVESGSSSGMFGGQAHWGLGGGPALFADPHHPMSGLAGAEQQRLQELQTAAAAALGHVTPGRAGMSAADSAAMLFSSPSPFSTAPAASSFAPLANSQQGRRPLSRLAPNQLEEEALLAYQSSSSRCSPPGARVYADAVKTMMMPAEEALLSPEGAVMTGTGTGTKLRRFRRPSSRDNSPLSQSAASSLISPLSHHTQSQTSSPPQQHSATNQQQHTSIAGSGPANRNSFHAKLKAAAGSLIAVGGRRVPVDKLHHLISTTDTDSLLVSPLSEGSNGAAGHQPSGGETAGAAATGSPFSSSSGSGATHTNYLSAGVRESSSPPPPDAMGCHVPTARRAPGNAVKIIKATSSSPSSSSSTKPPARGEGVGGSSPSLGNSPSGSSRTSVGGAGSSTYTASRGAGGNHRRGAAIAGATATAGQHPHGHYGGPREELPPPPSVLLSHGPSESRGSYGHSSSAVCAGGPSLRPTATASLSENTLSSTTATGRTSTHNTNAMNATTNGPIVVLRFQRGEQMNFRVPKTSFVESNHKGRGCAAAATATGLNTAVPTRYEVGKTYLAYIRGVCSPYGSFGYCDVGCCVRVYATAADMMAGTAVDQHKHSDGAAAASPPVIHGNLVRRIDPIPQSEEAVHQGELRHAEATVFQETLHRIQLLNIPVQLDSVHITHDGKVCVLYVHFFSTAGPQRDTAAKTLQKDVQRFVTYTVSVKSA